jgi:hypothetical protein
MPETKFSNDEDLVFPLKFRAQIITLSQCSEYYAYGFIN